MLENSFVHGNKKLSEVRLIIDEGSKGHLITIEDNGDGFNYSSVNGWLRGAGKERHNKIRTIRLADSLDFIISYEDPGNTVHIKYSGVEEIEEKLARTK